MSPSPAGPARPADTPKTVTLSRFSFGAKKLFARVPYVGNPLKEWPGHLQWSPITSGEAHLNSQLRYAVRGKKLVGGPMQPTRKLRGACGEWAQRQGPEAR